MMFQAMGADPPTISNINVHISHINIVDIEVNKLDPDKFIDIAAALGIIAKGKAQIADNSQTNAKICNAAVVDFGLMDADHELIRGF